MGHRLTATFYVGDAIEVMNKLPEKSVDLILTSPPFLALRSYLPSDHPDKGKEGGSQSTPGEYIDWLLDVVEACARVLAPHGSLCVELGDTYAGGNSSASAFDPSWVEFEGADFNDGEKYERSRGDKGYKRGVRNLHGKKQFGGDAWPLAKSLSLIPESFRFAMVYGTNPHTGRRTEPWRLRNVIRWVRPNPPVGALGDKFRPATSELMVFCKSAKRYFDLDAVRSPYTEGTLAQYKADPDDPISSQRPTTVGPKELHIGWKKGQALLTHAAGAPPLDWWNIPPGGYEGAHYAVWPPELCVKPVKAMCPERVCKTCGEPSRRISENSYTFRGEPFESPKSWDGERLTQNAIGVRKGDIKTHVETLGFSDCGHNDWRPGLVLDPFAGSGTTLAVTTGHGRDAIGIDLDSRNFDLALQRVGPFILSRAESV